VSVMRLWKSGPAEAGATELERESERLLRCS
jgi:hypothetical protein